MGHFLMEQQFWEYILHMQVFLLPKLPKHSKEPLESEVSWWNITVTLACPAISVIRQEHQEISSVSTCITSPIKLYF